MAGVPDLTERNARIVQERRSGSTLREIGGRYGLSAGYVGQIVDGCERSARILEMRLRRATFAEIGEAFGISPIQAAAVAKREARRQMRGVEERRREFWAKHRSADLDEAA